MKSNKGITLVALVITIIVLLILAGVSISLVVGDNGIMTRAKDAGEKSGIADAESTFELAVAAVVTDYWADYANGATGTMSAYVDCAKVHAELQKSGWSLGTQTGTLSSGVEITSPSNQTFTLTWTPDSNGVPKKVTATKKTT